jgi:hypothetical protein
MNRFSRKLSHTTKLQIGLEEIKQVKQSGMSWREYQRKRSLSSHFVSAERSRLPNLYHEVPESTQVETIANTDEPKHICSAEEEQAVEHSTRNRTSLSEEPKPEWSSYYLLQKEGLKGTCIC